MLLESQNKATINILMSLKLYKGIIDKSSIAITEICSVLLEYSVWLNNRMLHMVNVCLSYLYYYLWLCKELEEQSD